MVANVNSRACDVVTVNPNTLEVLILVDLTCLEKRHPNRKLAIRELEKRLRSEFDSPESVDRLTPPSRRILQAVPEYAKVVDGCEAIREIGLEKTCRQCPHFDSWLKKLEVFVPLR
jgi:hypothetical protein